MRGLLYAARPLAWDFFPSIAFAVLMAMHVDVRVATAVAWGVGLAQVAAVKLRGQTVPLLQWAGFGLAVVFGLASVVTQDPRFLMVKPTIIYLAVAVVMLKRGWMLRYLPPIAGGHGDAAMIVFGYVWAGLMAFTGIANLVVALWFTSAWPAFLAVFPIASKLALFLIQYLSVRAIVRARISRAAQAQVQAQPA
jgi:intracellular septation protein A